MNFHGIEIIADLNTFTEKELEYYAEVTKSKFPKENITRLKVSLEDDDRVRLDYTIHGEKFERIRRITGYLTGTLNTWNNAKQAEEKDRVKHN